MTTTQSGAKKPYHQPALVAFGSVRGLTGGSANNSAADATLPAVLNKNPGSDRRFKENVVEVGTHPAGFPLYLFDYKAEFAEFAGMGRQFGVMADEVEPVCPAAVSRDEDGYARVDYGMLGITRH